ncbi:hypothetical protein Nepgr_031063 [Nepenthes gracilis]|uniref:START domain-containing protein n=1 Tax=Nepenthes gracilis TaxID=150966 RepID=A0AAD3Y6F7_NEPGR|nr:hypothetical protein Nepgr_031063 [Nepenthes gracilis]
MATEERFFDLMEFMKRPAIVETLVDLLLCAVPIWLAVMIGLVIGWSWRPRLTGLMYLGLRSKFRFLWTAPPGFGARRLWLAFTALSAFSVLRKVLSNLRRKGKESVASEPVVSSASNSTHSPIEDVVRDSFDSSHSDVKREEHIVTENDLDHLLHLLEGNGGEIAWQIMMERSTPSMKYQAWHHDPEIGPTIYRSRTVFEDATPELVRDFFWDDEFRPKWDPMLMYFKILEECPHTGTMIVHWIKKFPFFCSDREYIIGRRIWEVGKAYYCVTKGVPYANLPKRDKPRRVEHYFSSWIIKPVESYKGDGQLSACEVALIHYEDMGIPKDVARLGVRHGMWGTVKKLHAGMRAYQKLRNSEASLSRSALMARITTRTSFGSGAIATRGASGKEEGKWRVVDSPKNKRGGGGVDWKWVVVGGTVAVICGLRVGVIGKALLIASGRRIVQSRSPTRLTVTVDGLAKSVRVDNNHMANRSSVQELSGENGEMKLRPASRVNQNGKILTKSP